VAGNLIVVAVSWGDNPAPAIRASDGLGNTYSVATNDFDPGNRQGLAILYAANIRAGANTVTVTFGVTGGYRRIIISEYSGIAAATPLDAAAKNKAGATTASNGVTSTAATTTTSGDLIFGVAMDDSGLFGTINPGQGSPAGLPSTAWTSPPKTRSRVRPAPSRPLHVHPSRLLPRADGGLQAEHRWGRRHAHPILDLVQSVEPDFGSVDHVHGQLDPDGADWRDHRDAVVEQWHGAAGSGLCDRPDEFGVDDV
jgi:hypothetical protein